MSQFYNININILKRYMPVILAFVLLIIVNNQQLLADGIEKYKIKTVVIDAGHGGKDPGAVCSTGYEKDLVLDIALKVGKYIEENIEGVKVIYTRDDDTFVELYKRAKIANDNNADFFISIHANANSSSKPFGSETYVMGLSKSSANLSVAQKENSVILQEENYEEQYEGFDPNSPESYIIFSLYQNAFLDQSLNLAALVQDQFRERVGRSDRGVKQEGFLVLWKTAMPSLLIELGFISNPDEAKFLFSEEGKDFMASAIYRAFRDYKTEYDKNITTEYEDLNDHKIDSGNNNLSEEVINTGDIIFTVQFLSSKKQIKDKAKNFRGLENVKELLIDSVYKYTFGSETNFDKITEIQSDVRNVFPDAFTIALKNGKKIPINQALKEIKH